MGQPYIAFLTFKRKMEQPSPAKHTSCVYEKENVRSALAAAKMWLLKGCMLKVKKIWGLSWCVTIPYMQISLPGQGIRK